MSNQQSLQKTIGLPQAVALYIGAVLGSGVLIVPGLAAQIAGPASLLAWGFMALLIVPLALSMGLLSAQFPHAGGVSHFVEMAFGPRFGALVGWFFLMSVPIGAPVAALTGAGYLTAAAGWGEGVRVALAAVMLAAGLLFNIFGMKVVGPVQIAVVAAIIAVLILAIIGAAPHLEAAHFTPFMPHGAASIGRAAAILFWCFIGWEAVSHMSEEFTDPRRAAVKGVTAAAVLIGVLYFLTALATVGTGSYTGEGSDASLVRVISLLLGHWGGMIAGVTGVFICTATIIAYTGAASRLAYALARGGSAPGWMGSLSLRYHTPVGGIGFLAACFTAVTALYATGAVPLSTLIQFPNATFILTYLGGCAAGIRLLKGSRMGRSICIVSFITTAVVFPFTGWAILYPLVIIAVFLLRLKLPSRSKILANGKS